MAGLTRGRFLTSRGALHFSTLRDPSGSARPLVFMLHGALRQAEHLADWAPVLKDDFDVMLCDLPGHGLDPAEGEPTVNGYANRLYEVIKYFNRPSVILGESLGGLIALGLAQGKASNLRAVLAADPPLSTAKQWCVRLNLEMPSQDISPYQHKLFEELLGMRGGTIVGERLYYSLIEKANRPTTIMAGTRPLFPARASLPIAANLPSFVDDCAFIDQIDNKFVSVKRIKGAGHLCITPSYPDAMQLVMSFCREHLQ